MEGQGGWELNGGMMGDGGMGARFRPSAMLKDQGVQKGTAARGGGPAGSGEGSGGGSGVQGMGELGAGSGELGVGSSEWGAVSGKR